MSFALLTFSQVVGCMTDALKAPFENGALHTSAADDPSAQLPTLKYRN